VGAGAPAPAHDSAAAASARADLRPVRDEASRLVREHGGPAAVLVDDTGDVVHLFGDPGRYLTPPSGPPTQSLLAMVHPGLRAELATALRDTRATPVAVSRRGLRFEHGRRPRVLHVDVIPLGDRGSPYRLVLFHERRRGPATS
jgi:two-component system CheB/CheR fusion protein